MTSWASILAKLLATLSAMLSAWLWAWLWASLYGASRVPLPSDWVRQGWRCPSHSWPRSFDILALSDKGFWKVVIEDPNGKLVGRQQSIRFNESVFRYSSLIFSPPLTAQRPRLCNLFKLLIFFGRDLASADR